MLERELSTKIAAGGAIEVGGYRSRGMENALLERELSEKISAGSYRSKGL